MNGNKVVQIIRREYIESVRKKSFLFGLVATPLMMALMILVPLFSSGIVEHDSLALAVVDASGDYATRLEETLRPEPTTSRPSASPQVRVYGADEAPDAAALDAAVLDGELSGWIRLPEDFATVGEFEYRSETITDVTALENLEIRITNMLVEKKASDLGVSEDQIQSLLTPAKLRTIRLGKDGSQESDFTMIYLKATALVMIMFFALMPTGQILMRSVIEEKSNRVIEVLLSSVTPLELMVGKIFGLGAVGLTLLGAWAAAGALLTLLAGPGTASFSFPLSGAEIGHFLLFFFPGYFLFAALLGTIGSICSSEREAQPFLTPISLFLLLPIMMGVIIAQSPDHILARILSFIPLLTPSLMMFRFAIKPPPLWEIIATWSVLVVATVAMFWIAARVFQVGILMYGKRPSLPEVLRWVSAR